MAAAAVSYRVRVREAEAGQKVDVVCKSDIYRLYISCALTVQLTDLAIWSTSACTEQGIRASAVVRVTGSRYRWRNYIVH